MPNPFLSAEPLTAEAAPAIADWTPDVAGADDLTQLMAIADTRFVLNVRAFMEALEPMPLFLRSA